MIRFLSNAEMRSADMYTINELGVPSEELMRRAGEAIAEEVAKAAKDCGKKITVVCGTGNNGGDGYVCARALKERGLDVAVFATEGNLSPDCQNAKNLYGGAYTHKIEGDIIVDCLFGTGLSREVGGRYAEIIKMINDSGALVVSADIPSGINVDNGAVMGTAVRADITVAIAEYKLGHVLGDGVDFCGATVKADIGIKAEGDYASALEDRDAKKFFPERKRNSHKGTYGSACIMAGSEKYMGAAALCLSAASRSGCGYVRAACPAAVRGALISSLPQVIFSEQADLSANAVAIGSGCGADENLYAKLKEILLSYKGKLIIDADGLNVLAVFGKDILKKACCEVLITPHAKEFSRLTGQDVKAILCDPVESAKKFAREYGLKVLLKGAATVITDGRKVFLNLRGSTALAKGGSGDMLTGLICGSAARGLDLMDAALCGAYVLGCAAEAVSAEKTDYCATATDILAAVPAAIKNITA